MGSIEQHYVSRGICHSLSSLVNIIGGKTSTGIGKGIASYGHVRTRLWIGPELVGFAEPLWMTLGVQELIKSVTGRNGSGQNGIRTKCHWTKWY